MNTAKKSFSERHFSGEITRGQIWFDVIFGIVVPILCLVFDPIIFTDYLDHLQIFAYLAIGIGIITLIIWMAMKPSAEIVTTVFSGILFTGAAFATLLGIVMLPLTILGLFIVLGILGFTPFFSAFVYLRNGIHAYHNIQMEMSKRLIIGLMILGGILAVGIPWAIYRGTNKVVSQSIQTIIHSENDKEINAAVSKLEFVFWCSTACYDDLVWAYHNEEDEAKAAFLARAYHSITGEDIPSRLNRLLD